MVTKKGKEISDIVNSTAFYPLEVGIDLSRDHRYLVNEMFKMFLHFSGQLSRNYENGIFDARNEFACKCSKVIVDALEKENLYDRKFWEDEYDKQLSK